MGDISYGASGDLGVNLDDDNGRLGTGISAVMAGTVGFLLGGPVGALFGVGAVVTVSAFNGATDFLGSWKDSLGANNPLTGIISNLGLISEVALAALLGILLTWLSIKLFF